MTITQMESRYGSLARWVVVLIFAVGVMYGNTQWVTHGQLREKESMLHKLRQEDMLAIGTTINRVEMDAKAKFARLEIKVESGSAESADINRRLERIIAQLEMVLKRMETM
jgi:predicted component of type VI protein secretion system